METSSIKWLICATIFLLCGISNSFSNSTQSNKIDEDEFVEKLIYPNPASDYIYLNDDVDKLDIFDNNGNLLESLINNDLAKVSISNFKTGFYIVRVYSKSGKVYLYKMAFVQ